MKLIPQDKANHALAGLVIGLVIAGLAATTGQPHLAGVAGLAAAIGAGVLKEAADWWSNRSARAQGLPELHGVEPLDAIATAAGGLAVYVAWATGAAAA